MVFVEGDDYRQLRRPGDDPAQFRSPVRLPRSNFLDAAVISGLVAWYRFEDSANTAIDATNALGVGANQTAFDGTVNGASYLSNGGVRDVVSGANPSGAYDFDGVDDRIPLPAFLDSSQSFSISVFINPDGFPNPKHRIITKFDGDNVNPGNFVLGIDTELRFVLLENGEVSGSSVPTGSFTHVVATFDASAGEIKLFRNGSQTDVNSSISGVSPNLSQPVAIAEDSQTGSAAEFFDGIIDDVRFYNRALSASEINQIYQNTKP
jgi:hypothetical protein